MRRRLVVGPRGDDGVGHEVKLRALRGEAGVGGSEGVAAFEGAHACYLREAVRREEGDQVVDASGVQRLGVGGDGSQLPFDVSTVQSNSHGRGIEEDEP